MTAHKPYDTPASATAEEGEVMLDGPAGVALSLTPGAARATARSIAEAAAKADAQPTYPYPDRD